MSSNPAALDRGRAVEARCSVRPLHPSRGLGLLVSAKPASASLLGATVTYQSLLPDKPSVLNSLGSKTVAPLTTFADSPNWLHAASSARC